jgi:RNA polymerase sigma-70 factor, ECF subfamily
MLDPDRIPADPSPPVADVDQADQESVQLMLRVRDGDAEAFEKLVWIHQGAIIGTVTRMLGSIDDAHDVSQQVFLRVWKSASRYEPTAKFSTWLYTIMRNLVFNEMRRRGRKREVSLDAPLFEDHQREIPHPTIAGADVIKQQDELQDALDAAIAKLPEKQRLAVVLRRFQETPYEELCEILGMSLPAVKSMLFRSRTELRKHLAAYLDD